MNNPTPAPTAYWQPFRPLHNQLLPAELARRLTEHYSDPAPQGIDEALAPDHVNPMDGHDYAPDDEALAGLLLNTVDDANTLRRWTDEGVPGAGMLLQALCHYGAISLNVLPTEYAVSDVAAHEARVTTFGGSA